MRKKHKSFVGDSMIYQ